MMLVRACACVRGSRSNADLAEHQLVVWRQAQESDNDDTNSSGTKPAQVQLQNNHFEVQFIQKIDI